MKESEPNHNANNYKLKHSCMYNFIEKIYTSWEYKCMPKSEVLKTIFVCAELQKKVFVDDSFCSSHIQFFDIQFNPERLRIKLHKSQYVFY